MALEEKTKNDCFSEDFVVDLTVPSEGSLLTLKGVDRSVLKEMGTDQIRHLFIKYFPSVNRISKKKKGLVFELDDPKEFLSICQSV